MAKQCKKFDITKKYTTREVADEETGELKTIPVSSKIGTVTVFSESPIPDDLSIMVDMPEHYLMGDNQLNVFAWRKKD